MAAHGLVAESHVLDPSLVLVHALQDVLIVPVPGEGKTRFDLILPTKEVRKILRIPDKLSVFTRFFRLCFCQ